MSERNQFFREPGNDTFCPPVQSRWNALIKWRNLSYPHPSAPFFIAVSGGVLTLQLTGLWDPVVWRFPLRNCEMSLSAKWLAAVQFRRIADTTFLPVLAPN